MHPKSTFWWRREGIDVGGRHGGKREREIQNRALWWKRDRIHRYRDGGLSWRQSVVIQMASLLAGLALDVPFALSGAR